MIHNFTWLIPGRLAGFGLLQAPSLHQLQQLRSSDVGGVVSLTEEGLSDQDLVMADMDYLHLPIADMAPPSQDQFDRFVEFVDATAAQDRATAVHCRAGLGRTGTMLAGYLVHQGAAWQEAVHKVRAARPGSIETQGQEQALQDFARRMLQQLETDR